VRADENDRPAEPGVFDRWRSDQQLSGK